MMISTPSLLTTQNVANLFNDCLFIEGEDESNGVEIDGVVSKYRFHPKRLEDSKEEIGILLSELPRSFHEIALTGGASFLQAGYNKSGQPWGEHKNIEQLMCLGIASGLAIYSIPKSLWAACPGGMPIFMVKK